MDMPSPKRPCPCCGNPTRAERCRSCTVPYERTDSHRVLMSAVLTGKPHNWDSASTKPEVAQKIRDWWTPERREQRRQEALLKNPDARYHGLSSKGAKLLKAGKCCSRCGSTKRLDIHHKDRDKRNQAPDNREILCHRCHMQEHAKAGETGWDSFHGKRATTAKGLQ